MLNILHNAMKNVTWRTIVRTILVMIIVFLVTYGLICLSNHIVNSINTENERLNNLIKVTDDNSLLYCKNSQVNEFLVNGIAEANEPVTLPELKGEYSFIKKIKYYYESHTETYTVTVSDGNGKSHTETRTEVVWDWEEKGSETYSTQTVTLLNNLFTFNNTSFYPHSISFRNYANENIKQSVFKDSKYYYIKKDIRYEYYIVPKTYMTTFISNYNLEMIKGYHDMTIEEVTKNQNSDYVSILFHIIILIIIIGGLLLLFFWEEIFVNSRFLCD